jgi:hypothetical protein
VMPPGGVLGLAHRLLAGSVAAGTSG